MYYWVDDSSDHFFSNPNNWSDTPGGAGGYGVPGPSDNILTDGWGADIILDADINVNSIDLSNPGMVQGIYNIAVTGTIYIHDGSTFYGGSGTLTADEIDVYADGPAYGSYLHGSGQVTVNNLLVYLSGVADFSYGNGPIAVNANLYIATGAVVTAGTAVFTFDGVTIGGTIDPLVLYKIVFADGGGESLIQENIHLTNDISLGAGVTHTFTAGVDLEVDGDFGSTATSGSRAVLRSATPTSHWNLKVDGTESITDNVDVTDCDASTGIEIVAVGSVNGGGNTNWTFTSGTVYSYSGSETISLVPSGDTDRDYEKSVTLSLGLSVSGDADRVYERNGSLSLSLSISGDADVGLLYDGAVQFAMGVAGVYSSVIVPVTVSSVSPKGGPTTGGQVITISGFKFQANATVLIDGNPATSVVVVNSTTITCVTPAGTAGEVDVIVTNPDLTTDTLTDGYLYVAVPTEEVEKVYENARDNSFMASGLALLGKSGAQVTGVYEWFNIFSIKDVSFAFDINGTIDDDCEIIVQACLAGGESHPATLLVITPTGTTVMYATSDVAWDSVRCIVTKLTDDGKGSKVLCSGR